MYAGAAEGWNVEIIAGMLPEVKWILYDWRKFNIEPMPNITIHQGRTTGGDFTDAIASSYSSTPNVMFMSDIRSSNADVDVRRDLEDQMRWTKLMNPVLSVLKFRAPFPDKRKPDIFPYLAGEILLQTFSGDASTETRLIVRKDEHKMINYSCKLFESQMFYHNMVPRIKQQYFAPWKGIGEKNGVVQDDQQFDNHYDSIFLLFVLEEYIKARDWQTQHRLIWLIKLLIV